MRFSLLWLHASPQSFFHFKSVARLQKLKWCVYYADNIIHNYASIIVLHKLNKAGVISLCQHEKTKADWSHLIVIQ